MADREPVGSIRPVATFVPVNKPEPKKEKDIKSIGVNAKVKKKGVFEKVAEEIIQTDGKTLLSWLLKDRLIPWIKDTCIDSLQQIFYKNGSRSTSRTYSTTATNYNYRYTVNTRVATPEPTEPKYDYNQIVLPTSEEAEAVIKAMRACIAEYNMVSIVDLYRIVSVTANDPQEDKWGWDMTNFGGATWRGIRQGYLLVLPPVKYLGD